MATVFIDNNFLCHTDNADGRTAVEVEFFNGKCDTFIEGHRFVPAGETWVREDGVVFHGEMVAPCRPHHELDQAQREYELQQLEDMKNALNVLGVSV